MYQRHIVDANILNISDRLYLRGIVKYFREKYHNGTPRSNPTEQNQYLTFTISLKLTPPDNHTKRCKGLLG